MVERERAIIRVVINRTEIVIMMTHKNLSHTEVSSRLGITKGHWSKLVWGEKCPGPEVRERIQKLFNNAAWSRIFIPLSEED